MVIWPSYAEGYSQTDEGKVITICYSPRVMDSFTVNDRAKLVIIEEIVQGETLWCDIIMYDPLCVTVVGFQSYISLKCRSLNAPEPERKRRFNETTAYQSDFFVGGVCPGGHFIEESSVALWPQSMEVWGRERVCCQPDIPESDTLTLSLTRILY